jgi:nucleotide-binding universal stress UspA family protein
MASQHVQVVVAYDFSPSAEQALARAIDVACRAPQHVLHVVAALDPRRGFPIIPTHHVDYVYAARIQDMIGEYIKDMLGGRPSSTPIDFYVHARIGHPAEQILDLAREVGADLIFIGSHGLTGLERLMLGSVSERVVREAKCPVMVARAKTYDDVELLKIVANAGEHKKYTPPHRFSYVNRQAITRPDEWPIG